MKLLLIINTIVLFIRIAFTSCKVDIPAAKTKNTDTTATGSGSSALNPVAVYGQLKVEGNKIKDKNSNPVQLRGMSFFWSQWMGGFYNSQVVSWLKNDFKVTLIRAAMGIEPDGYLQYPEREKAKIIAVVDAAIKEGLYVIIDWHDHNAHLHTGQAKAFFAEMAKRYGDKPNVIYEIYNEPLDVSWSGVIKPYSEAVIEEIRKYDPDNLIICGTGFYSQRVEEAANDPITRFNNIAYSLHYYAATHKSDLRNAANQALNKNIALMVTEFGTCEASGSGFLNEAETRAWWKFLDQHQISWCNWSVTDKQETASALKPGASTNGNWPETSLTPSGLLIRQELRAKNP